jgi:serine/threonine protein kinase
MNVTKEKIGSDLISLGLSKEVSEIEAEHAYKLIMESSIKSILAECDYNGAIGYGGSGIVFDICNKKLGIRQAMKLSRKSAESVAQKDPENPVIIHYEYKAMSLADHSNITRLYDAHITKDQEYCFISKIIEDKLELHEYLSDILESYRTLPGNLAVSKIIIELVKVLLPVVDALYYLNRNLGIYHMDVKPSNIIVNKKTKAAYVTDLGFARMKSAYNKNDKVAVGFTLSYAHKTLRSEFKMRAPDTHAKARNMIPATLLSPKFDIYAFGRSLLELLKVIKDSFGINVYSVYEYNYLHLMATLMLDGENIALSRGEYDGKSMFESEVSLGIKNQLLEEFKIKKLWGNIRKISKTTWKSTN